MEQVATFINITADDRESSPRPRKTSRVTVCSFGIGLSVPCSRQEWGMTKGIIALM